MTKEKCLQSAEEIRLVITTSELELLMIYRGDKSPVARKMWYMQEVLNAHSVKPTVPVANPRFASVARYWVAIAPLPTWRRVYSWAAFMEVWVPPTEDDRVLEGLNPLCSRIFSGRRESKVTFSHSLLPSTVYLITVVVPY